MPREQSVPLLAAVGFEVLVYDRRGFGRSHGGDDFAAHYVSPDFRTICVDAMAQLLDRMEIDRFHIVGQCEGGVVGVDYILRHPERVRTLATASTQCYSTVPMEKFTCEKMPADFDDLEPRIRQKYIRWHGEPRGREFYNTCANGGGCYGKSGFFDLRPALSQITLPTLVMYPDRDYFFDVEQGVSIYRHLARGELLVFPKCGHNIFEYYPRLYARQVVDFIRRH
jgi:pimeloyl-ACP methyl ester carboxylesterase